MTGAPIRPYGSKTLIVQGAEGPLGHELCDLLGFATRPSPVFDGKATTAPVASASWAAQAYGALSAAPSVRKHDEPP